MKRSRKTWFWVVAVVGLVGLSALSTARIGRPTGMGFLRPSEWSFGSKDLKMIFCGEVGGKRVARSETVGRRVSLGMFYVEF